MVSPLLFAFFINELVTEMSDCNGIFLSEEAPNVCSLLFVDDVANVADTAGRLQSQINILAQFCDKWGLSLNINKSQIVVFRNGGYLRHYEKWLFKGTPVKVVPYYKYLGIMFTPKGIWTKATLTLSQQAEKVCGIIYNIHARCHGLPLETAGALFTTMIMPIVTYGAEMWGFQRREIIEKVQTKYFKRILGLPISTPNAAVLGECGRNSLYVTYVTKCISYWIKLLYMDNNRFPKITYLMLYNLDCYNRTSWVTNVKRIVFQFGFGYSWIMQDVGNPELFICQFKQRVKDNDIQNWHSSITSNSRLYAYSTYKSVLNVELYLKSNNRSMFKHALAKFRCSCYNSITNRWVGVGEEYYMCRYCSKYGYHYVENEFHFLFECLSFKDLRKQYIPFEYYSTPAYTNFVNLMNSTCPDTILNLSKYLFYAFKLYPPLNITEL
jgi:hypothetical protein